MKIVKIIFFLFIFSAPSAYSETVPKPIIVAVLDSALDFPAKNPKLIKQAEIYQVAIPEIFSQDLSKVADFVVVQREAFRGKLKNDLRKISSSELAFYQIDVLFQISFNFPEANKVELQLNLLQQSTGKIVNLRKLKGTEAKILEMIDDFTIEAAKFLNQPLSKKEIKWIQKRNTVSLKALQRYGHGLRFYWLQTERGALLAREQLRKAEFFDVLFLPTYLAQAKTSLFLYENYTQSEKDLDKAFESLRKALFTDSKYLEGYELLSYVYFLKGDFKESVREGLRVLRYKPHAVKARIMLARSYIELKEFQEARQQLDKVLELEPGNKEAKALMPE